MAVAAVLVIMMGLLAMRHAGADTGNETLDPQLNEQVLAIPVGTRPQVNLQVTFFRPNGPGPFPVAVLNHGKDIGLPKDAKRYRSVYAARYFLSRGYAVVLPMMRGFAGSGGETWIHGCDLDAMGREQAKDIDEVIRYLPRSTVSKWLDMSRVIISGQSIGGWNTLAAGALNTPGVKGLVNFAGGVQAPTCPGWQEQLPAAAGRYGETTHVPSIWFYGDNDSKFPPAVWQAMKNRYEQSGGRVEMVAYGRFQNDAHNFLGYVEALPVWTPKLDTFLARLGLPSRCTNPELLPGPYPEPSGFARIDDIAAIPLIDDQGRDAYQVFLKRTMPRVFAIASNGSTVSTDGGYDPLARVLTTCRQRNFQCRVYAVDDQVVWPKPMEVPAPTQFARVDDAAAVPYLNDAGRQGYKQFLTLPIPRAFIIAPDGAWALSARDFDVLASALSLCQARHAGCKPYAVNDQVVWPAQ